VGAIVQVQDRRLGASVTALTLRVRAVRPGDARALEVLFAGLDRTWFRPHDLGPSGARAIAGYAGRDVYLIGFVGRVPAAYGMLRGWDEGYEVPSLGIAIRDGYRDQGLGRQMMRALHRVARERGADRVRLRVAPGNRRARHLYATLGYRQVGIERGELLLILELPGLPSDTAAGPQRMPGP
jgi:ribosomal protein S18 acetylase RimI-like enzyme